MKIVQAFLMTISSLKSNKMRSFLTMLGMIIGVAAVIAMISIMDGMIDDTMSNFSDMGADTISVQLTGKGSNQLTSEDFYQFVEDNGEHFREVSPNISAGVNLRRKEQVKKDMLVYGVNECYADMNGLKIQEGRFLTYADMKTRSRVCVIGTYIRNCFFSDEDPIGEKINIGNDEYTVVGVMEERDNSTEYSWDAYIYAPYVRVSRMAGSAEPNGFTLKMTEPEQSEKAQQVLENYLYAFYHNKDCYRVTNQTSMLDMMDKMTSMEKNVLVGIAGISLLVAGIGIMNIMLVSVSERTREIGIIKSLGARQRDIMKQFVIEAAVLSSLGGVIGIIIGGLLTTGMGNLIGLDCSPSIKAIGLSFGISTGIGLLFGYMPAKRAAKLNPIDALRSE